MRFAQCIHAGLIAYTSGLQLQDYWRGRVASGREESVLITCSHLPVITQGRASRPDSLKLPAAALQQAGLELRQVRRGGDTTYHGPGQLTCYPIIDLRRFGTDLHAYLRWLEERILIFCGLLDIPATRIPGHTGIFVNERKLASIGIAVSRWISWHGCSINICKDDLQAFSYIRPCGTDVQMTSVETLLGRPVTPQDVRDLLTRSMRHD